MKRLISAEKGGIGVREYGFENEGASVEEVQSSGERPIHENLTIK